MSIVSSHVGPGTDGAQEAAYAELSEQLPGQFVGHIRRRSGSTWYQVAMVATAIMVMLLILVYFGMTLAVGWSVVSYAIWGWTALLEGRGINVLRVLIYLAPLISGCVLLLFMLKPLVAPRAQTHSKVRLRERDEPALFNFIRIIAKEVGAPLPKRVDIDVQVNASASFRRGWFSLFSSDLVLTIGLPLVAALSTRQFGGVLAHEFGHFSQSMGMRLTFIIRNINAWFHRVVFERDRWDVWLETMRHSEAPFVGVLFTVSAFGVWLNRKILHGLMLVSHAVSCYTLRQMEYDADYYEAHLAGSSSFASTCEQLRRLNLASSRSYSELDQSWNQRRLADNLAEYIVHRSRHIPQEVLTRVQEVLRDEKTGIFDTHPTDRSRIARAEKSGAQGVLRSEGQARELFRNFDELARQATRHHYSIDLELPIEPQHLVPVEEMAALGTRQQMAEEAAERFFGYSPRNSVPLYPPAWVWRAPEYLAEGVDELSSLRGLARKAAMKMNGLWPEHDQLFERRTQVSEMQSLMEAGFQLPPGTLDLSEITDVTVQAELQRLNAKLAEMRREMETVQSAVGDRLAAALRLLWTDDVQGGMENGAEIAAKTRTYLKVLLALKDTLGPVDDLFLLLRRSVVVIENRGAAPDPARAESLLKNQAPVLIQRLNACLTSLPDDLDYPFEHSTGKIACRAYLQAHDAKQQEESGELSLVIFSLARVQQFFDRLFELQYRLLGELIMAAVQVEEVTLPDEAPFDADLAGPSNLYIRGQAPAAAAPSSQSPKPVEAAPPPVAVPAKVPGGPQVGVILPLAARVAPAPDEVPPPLPVHASADSGAQSTSLENGAMPRPHSRIPSLQELGLSKDSAEGATDVAAPPKQAPLQVQPSPGALNAGAAQATPLPKGKQSARIPLPKGTPVTAQAREPAPSQDPGGLRQLDSMRPAFIKLQAGTRRIHVPPKPSQPKAAEVPAHPAAAASLPPPLPQPSSSSPVREAAPTLQPVPSMPPRPGPKAEVEPTARVVVELVKPASASAPAPAAPESAKLPPPIPQAVMRPAQPLAGSLDARQSTQPPPLPQSAESAAAQPPAIPGRETAEGVMSVPGPVAAEAPDPAVPPPIPLRVQPQPLGRPLVKETTLPPIPGEQSAPRPRTSMEAPREEQPASGAHAEGPRTSSIVPPHARQLVERDSVPITGQPTFGPKSTRVIPPLAELQANANAGEEAEPAASAPGSRVRRPLLDTSADRQVMGPRSTRVIPALADLKPGTAYEAESPISAPVTPISLASEGLPMDQVARVTARLGPKPLPMERSMREEAPAEGSPPAHVDEPAAATYAKPLRLAAAPVIPLKKGGATQRIELPEPPRPKPLPPLPAEDRPAAVRGLKDSGPISIPPEILAKRTQALKLSGGDMPPPIPSQVPPPLPVPVPAPERRSASPVPAGAAAVPPPIPESGGARPKPGPIQPGPIKKSG